MSGPTMDGPASTVLSPIAQNCSTIFDSFGVSEGGTSEEKGGITGSSIIPSSLCRARKVMRCECPPPTPASTSCGSLPLSEPQSPAITNPTTQLSQSGASATCTPSPASPTAHAFCARCTKRVRLLREAASCCTPLDADEPCTKAAAIELAEVATVAKRRVQGAPRSVRCPRCRRAFHAKCYLRECGMAAPLEPPEPGVGEGFTHSTAQPCVVCLSGIVDDSLLASVPRGVGSDVPSPLSEVGRHVCELLRDGFTIIPLAAANPAASRSIVSESSTGDDALAPIAALGPLREKIMRYFGALVATYDLLAESGQSVPSLATGYSNFRERGQGRFEITRTKFIEEAISELIEGDTLVQRVLAMVLNGKDAEQRHPKRMSSGCFLALPGAAAQNLHTDGPALCDSENLYPYAVNVFVPLVDVGPHNGTEFHPGTQLQRSAGQPATTSSARRRAAPAIRVGEALLFDYRVTHRGLGNKGSHPRPNCYITFAQQWYTDVFNFGAARFQKELVPAAHFLIPRGERRAQRCLQGGGAVEAHSS